MCDFGAKVVFSSHLWQSNMLTVQQRREASLQAFEAAGRALTIQKLQQLMSSRERLVHGLTHELRTPINGILGGWAWACCWQAEGLPGAAARAWGRQRGAQGCSCSSAREQLGSALAAQPYAPPTPALTHSATSPPAAAALVGELLQNSSSAATRSKLLLMVRSSANCLLSMINTTLDTAALGCGVGALRRGRVSVWRTTERVVQLMRPLLHESVQLVNAVPEDTPLVDTDLARLTQVCVGGCLRAWLPLVRGPVTPLSFSPRNTPTHHPPSLNSFNSFTPQPPPPVPLSAGAVPPCGSRRTRGCQAHCHRGRRGVHRQPKRGPRR